MTVFISDSVVLAGEVDDVPIGHARILYDDIFGLSDTTLVASTEAVGFPKENAADYFTYDFWKPTASPATLEAQAATSQEINFMLVAAHNAGSVGAGLKPQYYNGSSWVDLDTERAPGNDRVLVFLFGTVTASRVRLRAAYSGTAPSIGVVMAGKALGMERSVTIKHTPAPYARKTVFSTNMSEAGQILGRSIRRTGVEIPIRFEHLTNDFVRDSFEPFIASARSRPFGWVWSPVDYPDDVAYCTVEDDIHPMHEDLPFRMNVEFTAKGLIE